MRASIIIVTMPGGITFCAGLLQSLRKHSPEDTEIIVVSNGLTPTFGLADRQIQNPDNRGWTTAVNQGLSVATGDACVMMNDDTWVEHDGWLTALLKPMLMDSLCGLVGPVTNYASGPQYLTPEQAQNPERWVREHRGQIAYFPRLVGFCLAVRAEVIEEIGGLDERFGTYGYDDDDYCLRAQVAGYKCAIALDSFVHHEGHATMVRELPGGTKELFENIDKNWLVFAEKWGLDPKSPRGQIPYQQLIASEWDDARDYFPLPGTGVQDAAATH
jgi:GT2 family glycosyltransferase